MSDASDRTLLFLSRLSDDPEGLAAKLAAQTVVLRLPAPTEAGEIALAAAATLLLRMDRAAPAIAVVAPGERARRLPRLADIPLAQALAAEHSGFDSLARFSEGDQPEAHAQLAFGAGATGLAVGSRGWLSLLGGGDVPVGGNPIAAAFSGVLAANEALKILIANSGFPLRRPLRSWAGSISLWDYRLDGESGPPLSTGPLDLTGVGFVGCGGISAATFWTLALLELCGTPLLIDDDPIDITNLNRLLFANHDDCGRPKVTLVKELLDAQGAAAEAVERRWEQLSQQEQRAVQLAIVSVDKDPVRRQIQGSLPRLILNGGTGDSGEYRISRHNFLDDACLACISHGDSVATGLEENLARFLGLQPHDLAPHLASSAPLPDALIERASATPAIKAELRRLPARRLTQQFCDQLAVAEGDAVSAPTLSATPGVLLAAEVVKHRMSDSPELGASNVLHGSVLTGPHRRWLMKLAKRDGCICTDETYRAFYRRRHSSQ